MPSPNSFSTSSSVIDQLARSLHHLSVVTIGMNLPTGNNVVGLLEDAKEEGEKNDRLNP